MPPLNSKRDHLSLPEVHGTIRTGQTTVLRRMLAFAGPGFLVAVGYMDPGNWATAIAGGSAFGYTLLSVVLLSNIMAVLLQALAVRMGIAGGRDLAQFCYEQFGKPARIFLWLMAETAIIATDLAEVIGTAIALNLLFNMPLPLGVVLTALDVFLILWLQGKGFRRLEAVVITLTLVIAACFIVEIAYSDPVWGDVMRGFIPQKSVLGDPTMLYLALGIIGATVMPHNLYLHSSIVQTRAIGPSIPEKRQAIRYATLDSTFALTFALFINAAILILAAAAFYTTGQTNVAEIQEAFHLLDPTLGTTLAATLFAVALLASGLNSTVTATLTGQIVMEGFIRFQLKPWVRRLVTRGIAIVPAVIVSVIYGESGTAELLVLSQVILSLQLPFAIVPLVAFTANRKLMNGLPAPRWQTLLCALVALVIITLNINLIIDVATGAI
ncbi:MAG: Nramp family divalent metal transporter [Loktanella sp.]|jgi:manganese transport protein|nr:Nramp family divalent metal transporter [Loktanella sp.]MDO7608929.1 Nramp family divalent metal transporter [Loktanella sp.]MDO7624439.1 Nramp family divalent metal transporter [Loktanella sp.]MDO7707190.1 Nramp family divalent metal transporter [Loktanella sp.]MDO7728619.1 Nramp family divalent metal transporter [Loktanella sp.]